MEIQYSPDLPKSAQLELTGLYDTMYGGTLFFPNENMPYEVAATTWTNLLGCDEYKGAITLDAIRAFGKETWGKYGGEPVNGFALTGPTPVEPTTSYAPQRRPVGGEEAARLAAGAEARVGAAVADDLRGAPGQLAVGEAALELLEAVAAGDAAAEVERQAQLVGEVDRGGDDVLHRRVAQVGVGGAAEVVVEEAVAADGDRGGGEIAAGGAARASQVRRSARMRSK